MSVVKMKNETRKVNKMGNSLGVGIPKSIIEALDLKKGDEIQFKISDNDRIVMEKKIRLEDKIDQELLEMVAETFREHDEVFKNLKDR
jgi:antitoxin MazE